MSFAITRKFSTDFLAPVDITKISNVFFIILFTNICAHDILNIQTNVRLNVKG